MLCVCVGDVMDVVFSVCIHLMSSSFPYYGKKQLILFCNVLFIE